MKRITQAAVSLGFLMMLVASFGAQAADEFPKLTPELMDKLNASMDTDWPHDPAVPDLPPMPVTDNPKPDPNAFMWTHFHDNIYPPKVDGVPTARTRIVTEEDPLEVDVFWSMRSPYSYLAMNRLTWLNSNYNVNVNIRPVLPVAVRSTKGGSGKAGGLFGLAYKIGDIAWDTRRQGRYLGVPFTFPVPDPVWQVWNPQSSPPDQVKNWLFTHPPEKQPYIFWLTRLACYASQQGKAIDYINQVSYLIWSGVASPVRKAGSTDPAKGHWPNYVKEYFNRIDGLDYDKAIKYIRKNPKKVDQCWIDNAEGMARTGHGGVPLMVYQDEPFFGGDRFDQFVYRLRQSGLTRREVPRAPFTTPPLRWPAGM